MISNYLIFTNQKLLGGAHTMKSSACAEIARLPDRFPGMQGGLERRQGWTDWLLGGRGGPGRGGEGQGEQRVEGTTAVDSSDLQTHEGRKQGQK